MQTVAAFVLAVATLVGISLIMALPTMLLWDWLMPELFGLKEVTLFQAWGLNFLCGMLFKSHNSTSK
jgi:hypothetical protein